MGNTGRAVCDGVEGSFLAGSQGGFAGLEVGGGGGGKGFGRWDFGGVGVFEDGGHFSLSFLFIVSCVV